jgi:hypothetical protein
VIVTAAQDSVSKDLVGDEDSALIGEPPEDTPCKLAVVLVGVCSASS